MKGELNIFEEAKRDKRRKEISKFIDHSPSFVSKDTPGERFCVSTSGINDRNAVVMGEQL